MTKHDPFGQLRLKIEYVAVGDLTENPLNPRTHSKRQINALVRAIRGAGFINPIIADAQGRMYAGHGRRAAAVKIGMETVPVVRVEHLSEAQLRGLMIADNRLADLSKWSDDLLAENFRLLTVEGLDLDIEATGFSMGEIDLILDPLTKTEDDDPDDAPLEVIGPAVNRVGDLWQLRDHRLACGSSLIPEVWIGLMDGEKAAMSCCDFPYNVRIAKNVSGLGSGLID